MLKQRLLAGFSAVIFTAGCASYATQETASPTFLGLPVTPRADHLLCEPPPEEAFVSWEQVRTMTPPVNSGTGSGILYDDISQSTMIGTNTFQTPVDTPLVANYHVWYPATDINNQPLPLRYIVLLNEKQLQGALGDPDSLYYDIVLQPGEYRTLQIQIPPLPTGMHDLVVMGIASVMEEPPLRGSAITDFGRFTLVAGDTIQTNARPYVDFEPVSNNLFLPTISLNLGFSNDEIRIWDWPNMSVTTSPDAPFTFLIQAGYDSAVNATTPETSALSLPEYVLSAFVMLVDYQQVPINNTEVVYGRINRGVNVSAIEVTITTPPDPGRHDIVVMRINYPGKPMCILTGTREGRFFPFPVYTWRVALENN